MRTTRSRGGRRGFTLLELVTSMVITTLILAGVAATFVGVQAVYQREGQVRTSVEGVRVASSYLERTVRMAGYGIDPRYGIDIGVTNFTNIPKPSADSTIGMKSNYQSTSGNFVTDDFAFRYRDPAFLRRGRITATAVNLDAISGLANFGVDLPAGRLLLVACPGGQDWTVGRTTAPITPSSTSVAVANDAAFPNISTASCMTGTGATAPFVMILREVRLRILNLLGPNGPRPFLVAFNSLDLSASATANDYDPIAADVESFQVSYVMHRGSCPTPPDGTYGNGNSIMGDDPYDTPVPTIQATRPAYDTSYSDLLRCTNDVSNVRAVNFDLSVRSLRPEKRNAFVRRRLADDLATPLVADGYYHATVSTGVRVPNLTSRSFFVPPLKISGDPTVLNDWGG